MYSDIDRVESTSSLTQKTKIQEIYELIEESSSEEQVKIKKQKKIPMVKNLNIFKGRNIIKKVKTHCLKIFYRTIKECADLKEILISSYRLKIYDKKQIYKIFKS